MLMCDLMTVIEASMLALLIMTCIYATITDLKNGIIKNEAILTSLIFAIILNVIYYLFCAAEYFTAYCLNVIVMSFISIAFYMLHIWAAGDSKLLILTIALIPARIYYVGNSVTATAAIIIIVFSIAYIYTILESIHIGIKEKSLFAISGIKADVVGMVKQYIQCTCIVTIFDSMFGFSLPSFYAQNIAFVMILNMIIVFLSYNIKFITKWWHFLILIALVLFIDFRLRDASTNINLKLYILVGIVLILRIFAEKYNYKTIRTADVKKGMVMAYSTIMNFLPSKVKGLPTSTTEDIRTRITEEEAESIRRWENSKYGKSEIVIVRKIPFAIFISVGTISYVIVRLLLL